MSGMSHKCRAPLYLLAIDSILQKGESSRGNEKAFSFLPIAPLLLMLPTTIRVVNARNALLLCSSNGKKEVLHIFLLFSAA